MVSYAAGHEKKFVSVVPREPKKKAVKKDKWGTGREKRVRCPDEADSLDREKRIHWILFSWVIKVIGHWGGRVFFPPHPPQPPTQHHKVSNLHHAVFDYIVVTEQFFHNSALYQTEQRLLQCI